MVIETLLDTIKHILLTVNERATDQSGIYKARPPARWI